VSDQVWSQSAGPAAQVVGGDGVRRLGGVQRPVQPAPQRLQRLCVGLQPLDVPLQLGAPAVDLLQPLPQQARPRGLAAQGGRLRVLLQSPGLPLHAAGLQAVGAGLLEDGVVVGEPFSRGVLCRAEPRRGRARGGLRVAGRLRSASPRDSVSRGSAVTVRPGHQNIRAHLPFSTV
uniref:Uncharacterized protein n=1 Tax=Salarias fasciatus TaxID=181472 RepID=A0A672F1L0_SALFA